VNYQAIFERAIPASRAHRFLQYALTIGAFKFPPEGRTLSSGRNSPYFFSTGEYYSGEKMRELGCSYANAATQNFKFDVIFGPAYKGIPLAGAITMLATQNVLHHDVGFAHNRKETKDHGEGGDVVGAPMEGKRVLIVDDVITSGGSAGKAVKIVQAQGGIPVGYLIGFDRQERGINTPLSAVREFEANCKIVVHAITTFHDLLSFLHWTKLNPTLAREELAWLRVTIDKLEAYQQEYGS
jgi:orotate phosphoribosyltransferase